MTSVGPPAAVEQALAAFRDLTTAALPPEGRSNRLRTEVVLPLARHYADALQGDDRLIAGHPDLLPIHTRATFAGARACLVILGKGRGQMPAEVMREVLRLGEGFCDLHIDVLLLADPSRRDRLARMSLEQLRATLTMVGAEATSDVQAARRARQHYAELGDEAAAQACDHLIVRLGGTLDSHDDPLRTVEMQAVEFGLLGSAEDEIDELDAALPTLPQPAQVADEAPDPPAAPASTSASHGKPRGPRPGLAESTKATQLINLWPSVRDRRLHSLVTALVLAVISVFGLMGFSAARRAAQAHRIAAMETSAPPPVTTRAPRASPRSATVSSAASSPTASAASVSTPPTALGSPPPEIPATAAAVVPATAGAVVPATAAAVVPAPSAPDGPIAAVAVASGAIASPAAPISAPDAPRTRARRLNAEGFRAYESRDHALAFERYRAATQADPDFPLPWYNLACIEAIRGNSDASVQALARFQVLDPEADLVRRVNTDRDFERVRGQPAFKEAFEALVTGRIR